MYSSAHFFGLIFILTLFSACGSIQPLAYRGHDDFVISNISGNPKVTTDIRLYNPNKAGATLKVTELTVFVNNKDIGKVLLTEPVKMKAQQEFILPFEFSTTYPKLAAVAISDLGGFLLGDEIPYKVEGYFVIQKCIFKKKYPFVFEDALRKNDLKY